MLTHEVTIVQERRYNRILGYILAVLMLLSGMCLENEMADSSFAFIQSYNPSNSYMCAVEEQFIENTPCTIEVLGTRTASFFISEVRRAASLKLGIRVTIFLLCAELVIRCISQAKTYGIRYDSNEPCHRMVVLSYIHKTDGKK